MNAIAADYGRREPPDVMAITTSANSVSQAAHFCAMNRWHLPQGASRHNTGQAIGTAKGPPRQRPTGACVPADGGYLVSAVNTPSHS